MNLMIKRLIFIHKNTSSCVSIILAIFLLISPSAVFANQLLGGKLSYDGYLQNRTGVTTNNPETSLFENRAQLSTKYQLQDDFEILGSFRLLYENKLETNTRGDLEIRDLYLKYKNDFSTLSYGKQQVVWGKMDNVRVLDVINPLNLREFIFNDYVDSRIPLWMFNNEFYYKNHSFQLIAIPEIKENYYPNQGSRFYIDDSSANVSSSKTIKPKQKDVKNWEYAIKLDGSVEKIDYTLNFFHGWSDNFVDSFDINTMSVKSEIKRERKMGFSMERPIGDFVVRGEAAYTPDYYVETKGSLGLYNPEKVNNLTYASGIDWLYNNWFVGVQYIDNYIFNEPENFIDRNFDDIATLTVSYKAFNDKLELKSFIAHDLNKFSSWLSNSIKYDITNDYEIKIVLDVMDGKESSYFGQFDDEDRLFISIKRYF